MLTTDRCYSISSSHSASLAYKENASPLVLGDQQVLPASVGLASKPSDPYQLLQRSCQVKVADEHMIAHAHDLSKACDSQDHEACKPDKQSLGAAALPSKGQGVPNLCWQTRLHFYFCCFCGVRLHHLSCMCVCGGGEGGGGGGGLVGVRRGGFRPCT